ncbi:cathepsin L [Bombyx mandarina]|uniref:Fibroinase n=3 Tax=Bombyx TaxID=7090 RepID=Q6T9Z7_BOMMO|nr:fibroinase precursor [Bombyx mori]XP_012549720.1 fibroinase isoform X1 [Bombyx mori]XP_028043213.1 cathepsin L [Bombyx mandarina]AAR87763.1 fibroinase precursor [Bombyx mori]
MKCLVLLLCAVAAVSAVQFFDLVKEEWSAFKLQHRLNYESEVEDNFRMKIYAEHKHIIAKHNQKYEMGLVSYKLGMNKYGDMLHHEFVKTMNGFNKTAKHNKNLYMKGGSVRGAKFISPANVKLPEQVDWRKHGAVTDIKDQGKCGSCWSFSTTGALEGQHFRQSGYLVSLSEQNLIDCSEQYGNNGCNGGLMDNAFKYIKDNGGIDTEQTYPYEGVDDKCRYNPKNTGAEDVGFVDIPEGDEQKLMEAVATVGPVSVAIDASHTSFQLYSSGVYNEEECSSTDLDHGVLVVGYGTDEQGVDYWLVKNSWGRSWGELGYIKMIRNKNNRCGIASSASYPLV